MNRPILILVGALVATGCYTFQPTGVADLEPGQKVRARVTGAFSDTLRAILLTDDPRSFEGVVVEEQVASTLIDVPQGSFQGMRYQTLNQRVRIPHDQFVEVEIKRLSQGRTVAAAGILSAVVGAIVIAQLNKDSGGAQSPGGGGPQDAIVSLPLARLSLKAMGWIVGR